MSAPLAMLITAIAMIGVAAFAVALCISGETTAARKAATAETEARKRVERGSYVRRRPLA